MRASPAECNSALRRDQALLLRGAYLPVCRTLWAHFLYGDRDARGPRAASLLQVGGFG